MFNFLKINVLNILKCLLKLRINKLEVKPWFVSDEFDEWPLNWLQFVEHNYTCLFNYACCLFW